MILPGEATLKKIVSGKPSLNSYDLRLGIPTGGANPLNVAISNPLGNRFSKIVMTGKRDFTV